ncbi:trimethyllysine dioxygenase [Rhinocladiella mackenziei CBS 650.93]|uniref:Trimethyllysine dioxygenase n=1 Tax=Rhinocladiella mackenziei CBS 650.93 TaxID=1442369 RepID=A0A0D2IJA4_9EURO|nr:trimethyllysine dioxygenase [Rhinocladiella mackenziei CBS 650.93]KIX03341.1 trimethyllysine dioxygenase [Rhinocladiella mackenziei CBS 650.93]
MTNQEVIIDFNKGTALRYPSFWLRDHCPCSECQHPTTHQRQLDTFTIDPEIKVSSVESTPSGLEVTWPPSTATEPKHTSIYPWEWLETHPPFIQASKSPSQPQPPLPAQRSWTHIPPASSPSSLPRVSYDSIMTTESGLISFLHSIHTYGLCFMPSTPATPGSTQELIERISHIRATHYGGFWDFTSEVNPIDTAYTNDPLPPHTDTTYFTDPAGLQLFHLLSHTSSSSDDRPGQGGESTFVDGFAAATYLHRHFPQHYQALSTYPITSAALGSPAGSFLNTASSLQGYPVLNHSSASTGMSSPSPATLVQIRWNNLDRLAPRTPIFPNHTALKNWYAAAREWARILESPEFLLTVKLQPGEPVIFDNWRVLHGRLGFEGKRRVCGAYVGMDDFRAKCRSLGIEV